MFGHGDEAAGVSHSGKNKTRRLRMLGSVANQPLRFVSQDISVFCTPQRNLVESKDIVRAFVHDPH